MPLNAGDAGYGAAPGTRLLAGLAISESAPLLIPDLEPEPEPEPEAAPGWTPLTAEELELAAGGAGWRKMRCCLMAVFWVTWVAMLAGSVAVVVTSPRPVVTALAWWQKSMFYQVQPDQFRVKEADESGGFTGLCDQLPYFKSLSGAALILQGAFGNKLSPFLLTPTDEFMVRLAQIQHLLKVSSQMGLKVVLDVCDANVTGKADESFDGATSGVNISQRHALHFWLEQGVAGFAICDTDAAYSEETLLEWRSILKTFSEDEEDRILVVKQKGGGLAPLNASLVDVVMRPIVPLAPGIPTAAEVGDAIEEHLQTRRADLWISWTAGGQVPRDLKKLLLVLMMTLPGSPAIRYGKDGAETQGVSMGSSHGGNDTGAPPDTEERSSRALLTSLSGSRSREEALLYGTFSFLPFNSTNTTIASSPPVLAFLRSWGCVQFLVLLNVGPELRPVDPSWALSLPDKGAFVASTEMDRLGSATLDGLQLRPHEAVVIKLVEAGSYS